MTLKEKFRTEVTKQLRNGEDHSEYLEKIADEFAIEFAEWICKHHETDAIVFGILDTKELLKTFKEQKGL